MYQDTIAQPKTLEECWREIERLRAELRAADHDPIWQIYTRVGMERRIPRPESGMAVIAPDIDEMHERNAHYTHDGLDARMVAALLCVREHDEVVCGRWYQGDEILIFCPAADAVRLAERLRTDMHVYGLSATFAVAGGCTRAHIAEAFARIESAKEQGERGRVLRVEGGRV